MKKVTVNHSHSLLIDFKSIISICLSVSFLLAFILPASASVGDDFSDCEDECTDTPFELSYEEGDLPLQELKTAVLNAEDVPSFLVAIIDKGVACVVNGVTLKKYSFVQIEVNQGNTVVYGLWHNTNISPPSTSICTYSDNSSAFEWTIVEMGINCPLIKQTKTYYCGFATLLQIMYGAGTANCLPTNSLLHSQMQLLTQSSYTNAVYYNPNTPMMPQSKICDYLNDDIHFTDGSFDNEYFYYERTYKQNNYYFRHDTHTDTIDKFVEILNSIKTTGYGSFFLTSTGGSPYKLASGDAHYVAIIGYDPISECAIIENSHYEDTIYGIYAVPINSLYTNIDTLFWCMER